MFTSSGQKTPQIRRFCAAAGSLAWVGVNDPQSAAADFYLRGAHVILSGAFPPLVFPFRFTAA